MSCCLVGQEHSLAPLNFAYPELPLNELQAGFRAEEVIKRALDAKISTAPKQSAGITNDDPLISGLASFTFSASAGGYGQLLRV
ncbi:hypothetical protein ASPCAL10869 [Aspergillus calidoustus]|nr:hypothetical protein ASPCAL10869 [Aspergillus calidoustus]